MANRAIVDRDDHRRPGGQAVLSQSSHRSPETKGAQNKLERRRRAHIGGVMPSRPTPMRPVSSVPSSFLAAPKMMTLAPGFTSDFSALTKVTIGVPGGTTTFFSPSLYLTRMFWPSVPAAMLATVALVMVLFGRRSQGRNPSPAPRWASGKM